MPSPVGESAAAAQGAYLAGGRVVCSKQTAQGDKMRFYWLPDSKSLRVQRNSGVGISILIPAVENPMGEQLLALPLRETDAYHLIEQLQEVLSGAREEA